MIIVHGSVSVPASRLAEVMQLSRKHVARSRTEHGCLEHGVYADAETEGRLVFVEKWLDEASLKQHFAVPESVAFVEAVSALASEPPSIKIFKASELTL